MKIKEITRDIYKKFDLKEKYKKPIKTKSDILKHKNASHCYICKGEFDSYNYKIMKVYEHNHFTGEYRGAAHDKCNKRCQKPKKLPVIFHNLQGCDSHLFIKEIGKIKGKSDSIPLTEEKYLTFSKKIKVAKTRDGKSICYVLKFIDSFKFMQSSLAKLAGNLQEDEFINLKKIYKPNTKLLTRKGVYHMNM